MNLLFWFGIAFTVVAPVIIGIVYSDQSTSWVAALCGAFITFMSKIESLAELSLGPVKAKMKEQIEKATATIDELQKVALVISEGFLTDLMAGSFMGGMNLEKRFELHDKIIEALDEIGVSREQLGVAEENWKKGVSVIFHRAIRHSVEERKHPNRINPDASEAQKNAGQELQELLDFKRWQVPTPHQIRAVLRKHGIDAPRANTWIDDYEHYLNTNEIRNTEELLKQ